MVILWYIVLATFSIISLLLVFVMASGLIGMAMTRVPYVRTRAKDILEITNRVQVTSSDVVYDLGSGDGKASFIFEKASGAKVKGFELTLWTYLLARTKKFFLKSKSEFVLADFFKHNWSEATVVYCYLYPHIMTSIGQKAKEECKRGTKIIARDFYIKNLKQTDFWKSSTGHHIYVYTI